MKLKNLLILVFILIAAVPLFVGLHSLNQYTGEHYRRQVESHLESLSLIAKKRVIDVVERIEDNTALVASRTQMRISLSRWMDSGDPTELDKIHRILDDAKNGLRHLKDISLYDRQGRLVATTADQPPVRELPPLRSSEPTIRLGLEADQVLAVSRAPLTLNDESIGFIRLAFFTDFIADLVRDRTGLGMTGEWLFAVRHESGDALFAVPLKYDPQAAFRRRVSRDRMDVPIIQALLGNELIMSNAPDYRETRVLASTRYISDLDWGLVAKMNEEEVNQLVNQNRIYIYFSEFVIVSLAVLAGIVLSVYIAGPIEKLKAHTAKVARGSFEEPPETGGWQEVKELNAHFRLMIEALKDLNENLQKKVEERTQALNAANEKLSLIATQDPLTGLHNRRYFAERLEQEFSRSSRYDSSLALVILDVDRFKKINDTYGHPVGDEVLKGVADHLAAAIRESDVVARIGGEEFCLILPECTKESALLFLERVREELSALKFHTNGTRFSVTCSFGVAFQEATTRSSEVLMKHADQALYQAKERGRNQVVEYLEDGRLVSVGDKDQTS
ncbi:MAG: diguanylate cyclase [Marinobacter sp.]|uniref:diguanylate cyclase domain-containing protein n=1 Tax=Marinobacter sp. TaxID=50741 RepID=UPI00299E5290|nr:diguanylate cyclase [Marinobacter sp.]MDX1755524.1 diguanylate cyclase [Marinobacter sp.]